MDVNRKPTIQKTFTDISLNIDFDSVMISVKKSVANYEQQAKVKSANQKGKSGHQSANF